MSKILNKENRKNSKLEPRQLKAMEMLADNCKIEFMKPNTYLVHSQSGEQYYTVKHRGPKDWSCNCPDYANRQIECKHIYAVKFSADL
jgi:hypothetical protein